MRESIGISTGHVNGYITGRGISSVRPFYRTMLKAVLERIEQRLRATGLSATGASMAAGLGEDAIRNLRRAVKDESRQGISTNTLTALAPVLKTTAAWLLDGTGDESTGGVPIIGMVGANPDGAVIYTTGQEAGDMAPIPPGGSTDCVALEVRGHSMRGLADDGALIYISDQRTPPSPDMLGHVVLVETEDGQVLLKRLLRGTAPKLYDLESLNGPTLHDQRLVWAAHVTAIIPPHQARKVILRAIA